MGANQSFNDLMARLRDGDDEAAARVFKQFSNRLVALARRRLDPRILQKVDAEDVLQSVFRSFFRGQATGQIDAADSWDGLWDVLVMLTLRKCGRRVVYFHAARRDIDREAAPPAPRDQSSDDWQASAPEPTPEEAAMLTETVERLMRQLDGRQRDILALSLQGLTTPEISDQLGCTERTVFRVMERVREKLEEMNAEGLANGS
jgi:RNA polymerase sigma-70 factor (ECF subfamily)